jgi:hypothetical protein
MTAHNDKMIAAMRLVYPTWDDMTDDERSARYFSADVILMAAEDVGLASVVTEQVTRVFRWRYIDLGALVERKASDEYWITVAVFKFGVDAEAYVAGKSNHSKEKLRFRRLRGEFLVEKKSWFGTWMRIAKFDFGIEAEEYVNG